MSEHETSVQPKSPRWEAIVFLESWSYARKLFVAFLCVASFVILHEIGVGFWWLFPLIIVGFWFAIGAQTERQTRGSGL